MKMLVDLLDGMNPNARKNMITAMSDVRPSHLLDVELREACGMDGKTGEINDNRARSVSGFEGIAAVEKNKSALPETFIESLL